jgi:transposase-like protein
VQNTRKQHLQAKVREHVEAGATVYTDALLSYHGLKHDYEHQAIDHAETYVRDTVHTNGLESYWSLLKRALSGTYISVEPFHLFRYLDEQAFRFNERASNDFERFALAIKRIVGKRLTYKELIAAGDAGSI